MQVLKRTLFSFVVASLLLSSVAFANAAVSVKGYYRKDGTYVAPHYRSNPDGNPYNNWSFPGNTNPYTGKVAPGNPDTYLKNYYGDSYSGSSYSPSVPSYSPPSYTAPSYSGSSYTSPSTYRSRYSPYVRPISESSCDSGFYIDGQNCNPLPLNARAKSGGLSGWECNAGYVSTGVGCTEEVAVASCPLNAYPSGSSCYCNSGYVAEGNSCITKDAYCKGKYGSRAYFDGSTCINPTCPAGYDLIGSECLPNSATMQKQRQLAEQNLNQQDVQKLLEQIKSLQAQLQALQAARR
jgi:hypothetical protein